MKRMSRIFALVIALAMLMSLSALASGEASGSKEPAEPVYTESAERNPDAAITLDGVAMGQVQRLVTTASQVFDGGEADTAHSTMAGLTQEDGVTYITSDSGNVVGVAIRNTGAFVLGGESDPALVAEKIRALLGDESYSERIAKIRDKYIANFGRSGEVGGQYLIDEVKKQVQKRNS